MKPFAQRGFGSDIDSRWETETADFNAARRERSCSAAYKRNTTWGFGSGRKKAWRIGTFI